jgi:hypothetical protein
MKQDRMKPQGRRCFIELGASQLWDRDMTASEEPLFYVRTGAKSNRFCFFMSGNRFVYYLVQGSFGSEIDAQLQRRERIGVENAPVRRSGMFENRPPAPTILLLADLLLSP